MRSCGIEPSEEDGAPSYSNYKHHGKNDFLKCQNLHLKRFPENALNTPTTPSICSKCLSGQNLDSGCHCPPSRNKMADHVPNNTTVPKKSFLMAKDNEQISFGRRRHQFKQHKNKNSYKNNHYNFYSKKDPLAQKKKREAAEFRYGNYHQYYGYRNQGSFDSRISCMKREWFFSKDVLDIGCNAGHLTLSIARDFSPKSITGVDIDEELIKMAKRNVRHYIDYNSLSESDFPISLALSYGPIAQSMDPKCRYSPGTFPFNVQFVQGNYILPSDEQLEWQESFFDTILCFSLTKWIHLNWGDEGVKRLFHRAYAHLNPGGCFLLEAQAFQSYSKRKKITTEMYKHFNEIKFYPEMFNEYLIKDVGFASCELIDTPAHSSKGFSRPIYLFVKGADPDAVIKPKHVFYTSDSENSCDYSDVEQLSD